jgi:hypothetical protein
MKLEHPMTEMRYDEERGIYRDCKWCGGRGCICCPGEAAKDYKKQFPNGPVPIATFDTTTPEGVEAAKQFIHDTLNPPPPTKEEMELTDQILKGLGATEEEREKFLHVKGPWG